MIYNVNVSWDNEAAVWCAVCDEIPLALECGSFDALIERVKTVAAEILSLNSAPAAALFFKAERTEHTA